MSLEDELHAGVRLFNQGRYFEAHEALEDAWKKEPDVERRRLLHGLTQIAVGLVHLGRGNRHGTVTLLAAGIAKLQPLPSPAWGVHLEPWLRDMDGLRLRCEAGGELLLPDPPPRVELEGEARAGGSG